MIKNVLSQHRGSRQTCDEKLIDPSDSTGRYLTIRVSYIDIIFGMVCSALLVVFFELFYRQTIAYDGRYGSDTISYVINAPTASNPERRIVTWIFNQLYHINESTVEIAIFLACVAVGIVISIYILVKFLLKRKCIHINPVVPAIMSVTCIFSSSIFLPGIYEHYYKDTWANFAWHSPTQHFMTLFSIISFLLFIKLYDNYKEKIEFHVWLSFSICLFLSAWAKPAFIMCFFPVIAVTLLWDLIKKDTAVSRKIRLRRIVIFGSALLPAFLYFLFLNNYLYGIAPVAADAESVNRVIIDFGFWYMQNGNPILKPLLGLTFPLIVLCFNIKKIKTDVPYRTAWLTALCGILIYLTFIEDGSRMLHGNFGWGKGIATTILFIVSIYQYLCNVGDKSFLQSGKGYLRKIYLSAAGLVFALHVVSGLVYFYYVLRGYSFYI